MDRTNQRTTGSCGGTQNICSSPCGQTSKHNVHVYLHYVYSLTYRVRILQIFKGSLFAKQLPVHNHREVHIKNDIVVDSQTKNQSNQGKLTICLK